MPSIQLTYRDSAQIVLALMADLFSGASRVEISRLRHQWLSLGLRVDDLIQGLVALARDDKLTMDGSGKDISLCLSPSAHKALPKAGTGLSSLPSKLREVIEMAPQRKDPEESARPRGKERREGFS